MTQEEITDQGKAPYESPTVTRVGTLSELTLNPPGKPVKGPSDLQFGRSPFHS